VVQRYVLNKIKDKRLRVYVVWLPIRGQDNEETARQVLSYVVDPRARHFWVNDLFLAESYKGPLGLQKEVAWDVYLLFPAGTLWRSPVPVPSKVMQLDREEMPQETSLNGFKLAEDIQNLLARKQNP
jgi:hypothetical protein